MHLDAGPNAPARLKRGQRMMAVNRTHFTYRIDLWTSDGVSNVEHLPGAEGFQLALATYGAAIERWAGHHVAPGRAGDRGQPSLAAGVT
jgi:hypothetical protein